jgi:malonyl CoA-acyl carrier protein transacylase
VTEPPSTPCVLLVQAESRAELRGKLEELRDRVSRMPAVESPPVDVLFERSAVGAHRLAFVAASAGDALGRLTTAVQALANPARRRIHDPAGIYYFEEPLSPSGKIAFLFPGNGAQYPGMLANVHPLIADSRWFHLAQRGLGRALPIPTNGEELPSDAVELVNVAVSLTLADLLAGLGVSPDMVAGHSFGEWVALFGAAPPNHDRDDELLQALGALVRCMRQAGIQQQALGTASVVVVLSKPSLLELVLARHAGRLFLAADNCPHEAMLGGFADAVDEAIAELTKHGAICERLPGNIAPHTPLFTGMSELLAKAASGVRFSPGRATVYSSATAAPVSPDPRELRRHLATQWIEPIRFRDTVEAMYRDGARIFIDVGPRGILAGFVDDTLRGRPHAAVPMNLASTPARTQLCQVVALLVAHHLPIDPRAKDKRTDATIDPSPRDTRASNSALPFIRELRSRTHERLEAACELTLADDLFLRDHAFGGRVSSLDPDLLALPVVPFSVSLEMLAEAAVALAPTRHVIGLRDVRANHWMAIPHEGRLALSLSARMTQEDRVTVEIRADGNVAGEPYVTGVVVLGATRPRGPVASLPRRNSGPVRTASGGYDGPYKWTFHGPLFRSVLRVEVPTSGDIETVVSAQPSERFFRTRSTDGFVLDPLLLEGIGQSAAHSIYARDDRRLSMLPFALAELTVYDADIAPGTVTRCVVTSHGMNDPVAPCDAVLIGPDGTLLATAREWVHWCVFLRPHFRTLFDSPLDSFLSLPVEDARPGARRLVPFDPGFLESMDGFWLRVLADLVLGADERRAWLEWGRTDGERAARLVERIVAKDAVRALLRVRTRRPWGAADVDFGPSPTLPNRIDRVWGGVAISVSREGDEASAVARENDDAAAR